jgi:hypothetical protein
LFDWIAIASDESRVDLRYEKGFKSFKTNFGPWMSWHLAITKLQTGQAPFDMGKSYEQKQNIDLDQLKK